MRTHNPEVLVQKIVVNDFKLTETDRHGALPERADVTFTGTITINGRTMPCELHLFRSDKEGWAIGKWYASMDINKQPHPQFKDYPTGEDYMNAMPTECYYCHKESKVAKAVAKVIHKWLNGMGYEIADGIGHRVVRKGVAQCTRAPWWLFHLWCDSAGPIEYGESKHRFYHTESREVVSPVYGKYTKVTNESSM